MSKDKSNEGVKTKLLRLRYDKNIGHSTTHMYGLLKNCSQIFINKKPQTTKKFKVMVTHRVTSNTSLAVQKIQGVTLQLKKRVR